MEQTCQDGITRGIFLEQLPDSIKRCQTETCLLMCQTFGWRCFADASMRKGNEEKEESDRDSYLAVVLLLRVRSCQFDMSLSGRVERSAWAKVQEVSTNAATRLQALHPLWDLDLSNHSDKSVGSFFVQDGSPTISSSSEQLACIKQHAETSSRVAVFPSAERKFHVSFGWRCFADASMRKGNEEKEESDRDSYLAVVLLLRVRSCQFDMSLSGRIERSAWAKVQEVSTNAATRLQALHPLWDLDLSNHSDKSVGSFFVQDGSPTISSSSEQLACIKQHAETSNDVLQFFHLQSIVTYLLVDAVLLMHQWGREIKKRRSQTGTLIWLWCWFCVSDPVSLICHCRAVLSAQLGQKCRMCQQMRQHDCKHCILCETWIFRIILTNLLDLSLSRMGVRQLAAPRRSLLVLNSMLRHRHVLQFFHLQSKNFTYLLVDAVLLMHQWGREIKKRRSQTGTLIWLWCCFCVSDPVSLICHCRAVLSAQLGQKCRRCQQMRQHDCKHCILCETWIFQIILTNLLDLSLSRMGVRQLAAPRSSLLVLNSMLRQAMTCCSFSICRA